MSLVHKKFELGLKEIHEQNGSTDTVLNAREINFIHFITWYGIWASFILLILRFFLWCFWRKIVSLMARLCTICVVVVVVVVGVIVVIGEQNVPDIDLDIFCIG